MDELSISIIGGAVGGPAGVFSKEAWDLFTNWIAIKLRDHKPQAIAKAEQNSLDFLVQLAQRVKVLEQEGEHQKLLIEDSLNHPSFSILLQKAMISSAQTEDKQKHEILARLVADRLSSGAESLLALTSQSACDAISKMNITQMKMLGCVATVHFIRPQSIPPTLMESKDKVEWWIKSLSERLIIYQDLTPTRMDYLHLASLSCIQWNESLSYSLDDGIMFSTETGTAFDPFEFQRTEIGEKILQLWEGDYRLGVVGLGTANLTTIGILIGVYVSDTLLGITTPIDKWGIF